jgi:hypothetical protein
VTSERFKFQDFFAKIDHIRLVFGAEHLSDPMLVWLAAFVFVDI